jgi:hypothetical protein
MQEVPISCGLFGHSGKRFTVAFGERITIAATGRTDRNVAAASHRYRSHVGQADKSNGMSDDREKSPGKAHRLGTRASANTSGPDFIGRGAIGPSG